MISKKKIVTIVGARPQFIKAAVVSRELRKTYDEILVHTGQHYDKNMSDIFFEELEIPKPDYNLGIAGGSHGQMTGEMIVEIEKVLIQEKPDGIIIYGDTNSTLAGAIAAIKLHIPIFHVEGGGRVGTKKNPEEVNRILSDHISTIVMYCTESIEDLLKKEGLLDNSTLIGDPMYDAFLYYRDRVDGKAPEKLVLLDKDESSPTLPEKFYYLTCHREENTVDENSLVEIMEGMNSLEHPTIYPVHPRNQKRALEIKKKYGIENIILCEPVGYLMSIYLVSNAEKIVTDSGGLQREAYFAQKQCVTILDFVAWPETMVNGCNQLAKADKNDILEKLSKSVVFPKDYPFGDGSASKKVVEAITNYYKL